MRIEVESAIGAMAPGAVISNGDNLVSVDALPLPMLRMARSGFCVIEANPAARDLLSMPVQDMTPWLERVLFPDVLSRLTQACLTAAPFDEMQVSAILAGRQVTLRLRGIASGPLARRPDAFLWLSLEEVNAAQVDLMRRQYETFAQAVMDAWPHPGWVLDGDDHVVYQNNGYHAEPPACHRGLPGDAACVARRGETGICGRRDGLSSSSKGWQSLVERVRESGSCGSWQVIAFPAPLQPAPGESPSQLPANQRVAILAQNLRAERACGEESGELPVEQAQPAGADHQLLAEVREQERASITREVHDSLGQEVTLLKVGVERLLAQVREQALDSLLPRVMTIENQAQNLMKALRGLVAYMRTDGVGERGLAVVATEYIVKYRRQTGIAGQLEVAEGWLEPPADYAHHLYRSLQEMLNNVVKHARATRFAARLGRNSEGIWLEVEDDGLGIQGTAVTTDRLRTLQERATMYRGGQVQVTTRPIISGTRVKISLPFGALIRTGDQVRWPMTAREAL
jgi:signal transduction histidine kinase